METRSVLGLFWRATNLFVRPSRSDDRRPDSLSELDCGRPCTIHIHMIQPRASGLASGGQPTWCDPKSDSQPTCLFGLSDKRDFPMPPAPPWTRRVSSALSPAVICSHTTPSNQHMITPSHDHTITPSHDHTITRRHERTITRSQTLDDFCPALGIQTSGHGVSETDNLVQTQFTQIC
eukprot:902698-Rhodomonas_salina.1